MIVTKAAGFVRIMLQPDETLALLEMLRTRVQNPTVARGCTCFACCLQRALEERAP